MTTVFGISYWFGDKGRWKTWEKREFLQIDEVFQGRRPPGALHFGTLKPTEGLVLQQGYRFSLISTDSNSIQSSRSLPARCRTGRYGDSAMYSVQSGYFCLLVPVWWKVRLNRTVVSPQSLSIPAKLMEIILYQPNGVCSFLFPPIRQVTLGTLEQTAYWPTHTKTRVQTSASCIYPLWGDTELNTPAPIPGWVDVKKNSLYSQLKVRFRATLYKQRGEKKSRHESGCCLIPTARGLRLSYACLTLFGAAAVSYPWHDLIMR